MASTKRSNVYLRIVPVKVVGTDGRTVETFALLDSGSDVSLCDKRLISELGLVSVEKTFSLTTLNEVKRDRCGLEVDLQVVSLDNEHSILLEGVWSVVRLIACYAQGVASCR